VDAPGAGLSSEPGGGAATVKARDGGSGLRMRAAMSEPITYWKWARDGMVVAACPEIQDGLYIIRERYDALHAKVRELEGRLAQKDETLGGLSRNYQNLMAFYDQHVGTPCEQIRHQQEIERLQERILDLEAKLREEGGK